MNHPHSLSAMYFLKFLWATLISSLWSLFFSKTLNRILLKTSPWIFLIHLITSSSLNSSRKASAPALKKTKVCPSLYRSLPKLILSISAYVAVLLSDEEAEKKLLFEHKCKPIVTKKASLPISA